MDIQGEKLLTASRADVWQALNDPEVLRRCLPGCDTFDPDGPNAYRVALQASVGPIRARFSGRLQLSDVVPPTSYALSFEGSGGVAGFGKGTANVQLEDADGGTRLRYGAKAQVGGRLAQVGARLIDGVTQRMADDFFSRFVKALEVREGPEAATEKTAPGQPQRAGAPAQRPVAGSAGPLPVVVSAPATSGGSASWVAAAISVTAAAVATLAAAFAVYVVR